MTPSPPFFLPLQDLALEPNLCPHSLQSPPALSQTHPPQPQTKEAAAPTPDPLLFLPHEIILLKNSKEQSVEHCLSIPGLDLCAYILPHDPSHLG